MRFSINANSRHFKGWLYIHTDQFAQHLRQACIAENIFDYNI